MGRYYRIEIGGPNAITFTNQVNGVEDPNALMVEYDLPVSAFHISPGGGQVTVWGVGLQLISQQRDFINVPITVYGGMQNGLPLATQTVTDGQQGVLTSGYIQQAFGNWLGLNQTLSFVIVPEALNKSTQEKPANLAFLWKKGTSFGDGIKNTLKTAFPSTQINVNVDASLILPQDIPGYYETVPQFASFVNANSKAIKNPTGSGDYSGISITQTAGQINVFDGTSSSEPIEINPRDLIGQATWIDLASIQFNTVMRADLDIGDFIQLPSVIELQVAQTAASQSFARNKSAFAGTFIITQIRHLGNSRQADATAWITAFEAKSTINAPANAIGTTSQ